MENVHVTAFRDALKTFNIDPVKIETLCANLTWMIQDGSSPSVYWDLIGQGTFKECYDIGEDIIIKFASEDNNTEDEEYVLFNAIEEGFGDIFLRTVYIPLDNDILPAKHISPTSDYYSVWDETEEKFVKGDKMEPFKFNYIIIQKKIAHTALELEVSYCFSDNNFSAKNYDKDYLLDKEGKKIPFSAIDEINITEKQWLRAFIERFGTALFYDLVAFNSEYGIRDLHEENIGFLEDGTPVIMDWWS